MTTMSKEYTKEYRAKNREKILAYKKEYYYKNREKLLLARKEYCANKKTIGIIPSLSSGMATCAMTDVFCK